MHAKCTQNARKIQKNQATWPEKSEKNGREMTKFEKSEKMHPNSK
jgi:hypothetical protein